jgi:hypothetical protein
VLGLPASLTTLLLALSVGTKHTCSKREALLSLFAGSEGVDRGYGRNSRADLPRIIRLLPPAPCFRPSGSPCPALRGLRPSRPCRNPKPEVCAARCHCSHLLVPRALEAVNERPQTAAWGRPMQLKPAFAVEVADQPRILTAELSSLYVVGVCASIDAAFALPSHQTSSYTLVDLPLRPEQVQSACRRRHERPRLPHR